MPRLHAIFPSFKKIILLGCIFTVLTACENDIREVYNAPQNKLNVDEIYTVESYMSQGGRMRAKLTTPVMLRYMDTLPRIEFPKSLHVDFFDSLKKVESQLNAKFGRYFENQNKLFLKDSVKVFNIKKDTLWTPELWWDQNQQKFYTDKEYVIKRENDYYYGIGMEATQDLKTVTLHNSKGWVRYASSKFPQ